MASREQCSHCKSTFQNKTILKTHINTNKKCLASRGLSLQTKFICEGCNIMLITVNHLHSHYEICRQYIVSKLLEKHEKELQEQSNNYENKLKEQRIYYEKELKELKESISKKKKYKEIDQEISDLKGIVKTLKSNFESIKIKNDVTSLNSATEKLEIEANASPLNPLV
jgi:myosin heavy subunit